MLKKNGWYVWITNSRSLERNLIWKLGVLNTCWKEPWKPENKTHALPRYIKQGIFCHHCLWRLLFSFPFVFSRHKGHKRKMIWLLPLNTHRFSSVCSSGVWEPVMGCLFSRACQEVWGCSSWKPEEGPCCGKGDYWNGGMWSPAERGPPRWRGPSSR